MLSDAEIRVLSEGLNEPKAFQKIRLEALAEAGHLPAGEFRYGLEIFTPGLAAGDSPFERDAVSYEFEDRSGVRIMHWAEGMKDAEVAGLLAEHFRPEHSPVLKNYYFAAAIASFDNGIIIVAEENSDVFVDIKTVIKKSGADFVFVVAKRGATLRLSDTVQSEKGSNVFGRTCFVAVLEGARVEMLSIQDVQNETSFFANKFSTVGRGGEMGWFDFHFGGSTVKSDIEDFLLEEGAQSFIRNVSLCGPEHFDFYNVARHLAPHTSSRITARGIAGSGGKVIYRGLIDMEKDCPGSVGKQEGRFLLAGAGAEIDAIPSLDIRSKEVTSSHALSINHLKDEEFFYPALRGIEPYRAQALLFNGFLENGFEGLPEEYGIKIRDIIQSKLRSKIFID